MKYNVVVNGKKYEVIVEEADRDAAQEQKPLETARASEEHGEREAVQSPMPGTIIGVNVKEGQAVRKGDVLFILEAMKMENEIMAGRDAVISKIYVSKGTGVQTGDLLALLK
jgi:biotin carboxyl carrier protein